jgi:hypothetical protein
MSEASFIKDELWDDLDEIPVRDLMQSESDEEKLVLEPEHTPEPAKTMKATDDDSATKANDWVSEESDGDFEDSREDVPDASVEKASAQRPVNVVQIDETSSLANDLYRLEHQLATAGTVQTLRVEKASLEQRLAESERVGSERERRINELRFVQLEILQVFFASRLFFCFQMSVLFSRPWQF